MPELWQVVEALARSAAHSPSWSEADATLIAEWVEEEKPPEKPAATSSKGGKSL